MKRVFGRWIISDWKTMSPQEKITVKRLCLVPLFAYGIFIFLNRYSLTILVLLGTYFIYKHFKRKK